MKRAVLYSLAGAAALLAHGPTVFGQSPGGPLTRPSAAQLLDVPVSGNPISPRQRPDIRNPYADDPNAVIQGEKLYNDMNCVGCHAPLGGGGTGPPLSDQAWIYGGQPAEIYLSIHQGRPAGMPAWGGVLPPQAIWHLVSYVESLSKAPASASGTSQQPAHPRHPVPNPMGLP